MRAATVVVAIATATARTVVKESLHAEHHETVRKARSVVVRKLSVVLHCQTKRNLSVVVEFLLLFRNPRRILRSLDTMVRVGRWDFRGVVFAGGNGIDDDALSVELFNS